MKTEYDKKGLGHSSVIVTLSKEPLRRGGKYIRIVPTFPNIFFSAHINQRFNKERLAFQQRKSETQEVGADSNK